VEAGATMKSASVDSVDPTANTAAPVDPTANTKICRICHEDENEVGLGQIFSPCQCNGSMRYVHVQVAHAIVRGDT
jgi:hypothetical protein